MTIPMSSNSLKPLPREHEHDCVEEAPVYSVPGWILSGAVYTILAAVVVSCALALYVHPTEGVLIVYLFLTALILVSMIWWVRVLVLASRCDLVYYSNDGFKWRLTCEEGCYFSQQEQAGSSQAYRDRTQSISERRQAAVDHLNYSFI